MKHNITKGAAEQLGERLNFEILHLAIIKHNCPTFGKGKICEHGVGYIEEIKEV